MSALKTEADKYIKKFENKTILIKISGELVNDKTIDNISENISVLFKNGIKIIVIHGGGYQADDLSKKLGVQIKKVNGRRITDLESLEIVKMVFSKANIEIIASLKKHNLKPVGLSGIDSGIIAKKREVKEVDYGFVGDVVDIDINLVKILLDKGFIPVIAPIACDENGIVLNINADTIAIEFAKKLGVEKLVMLSNVPGVFEKLGDKSSVISYLTVSKMKKLVKSNSINGGMIPKLESCISALNHGVKRIHLIDGTIENSILKEILTKKGIGTMIVGDAEMEVYKNEFE